MLKIKFESKRQNKDKYLWTTLTLQHFTSIWNYPGLSMGFVLPIFLVFCDVFIVLLVVVLYLVPNVALSLDLTFSLSLRFYLTFSYQSKFHVIPNFTGSVPLLVVTGSIIRPVFIAEGQTWFIRYMYYWNLQFLYKVPDEGYSRNVSCALN